MKSIAIVIPNYNGMKFLPGCLGSLRRQTDQDFETILIDNGSEDGSVSFVRREYPEVKVRAYHRNTGFCKAVNAGVRLSNTPYVLFLNNDVVCGERMVEELHRAIRSGKNVFSCCAKLVRMDDPSKLDDAGDYYSALGWAFAKGRGQSSALCTKEENVFACCGAAMICRRDILDRIGLLDERHFAYLEDIDLGYRAQIHGYANRLIPSAVVLHAGSGTSGSRHNAFKVRLSSRNSVWLVRKNMPPWQAAVNAPLLIAGTMIKFVYFSRKGLGREYAEGTVQGLRTLADLPGAPKGHTAQYLKIQLQLWRNCFLRLREGLGEVRGR